MKQKVEMHPGKVDQIEDVFNVTQKQPSERNNQDSPQS